MTEPVRLLVVSESDEYAARIMRELDAKGLHATTERVASADEMRAALGRGSWDAAVSDLGVPGFDVEEVVRLAREGGPDLPVIVVSERAGGEDPDRALRAGAIEFLPMEKLPCAVCAVERIVREAEVRREMSAADGRVNAKAGLLHTVVSNAPVILFAVDTEGTVTLFEGKGIAVFGPGHRDLVGLNVFGDMVGRCPVLAENCRRALGGEEVSGLVKVSTGVFLDTRCGPLRDEDGGVSGAICVATDVTERERARRALAESEARYRALVENTNDMAVAFDTDGIITYVAPQVERLGFSAEEIISRSIFEFVHEKDREKIEADFRRTMETGEEFPTEVRIADRDGRVRWFEEIGKIQRDETGRITGIIGILRDITDRKLAEEACRASEDKYRRLFNNESDAVMLFDAETKRFEDANPATLELFGYAKEEFLSLEVADISVEKQKTRESIAGVLASESGVVRIPERLFVRRDGSVFSGEIVSGVFVSDGRKKVIGAVRDITDRKRAEEELRKAHDELEQRVEERTAELHVMNDDLRREINERKVAEEALRESEERFRSYVEQASEGIFLFEPPEPIPVDLPVSEQIARIYEGRITEGNDAAARMHGYERADQVIGKALTEIHGGADVPENIAFITAFIEEGYRTTAGETREADRHGNEKRFSVNIIGIVENGRLVRVWGTQTDITERKRAEQALRESEEKFRSIVESSPMGIHLYELEPDGRLVFTGANPAADRILGVEHSQFVGRTIEEAFPPLAETEVPGRYRRAAVDGEGWRTSQLAYEHGEISGAYDVFAFQTAPGKMAAFFLDVTERERAAKAISETQEALREAHDDLERRVKERTTELAKANEQLRRSEEVYRSLVTHLPDAVTVTGPDGVIKYVSGHGAELHGAGGVEEMLGLRTADLVVPEDRERFEASLRQAFETGAAEAAEFVVLKNDGSTFIAEESFGVLREVDGEPGAVVTVVRDVTGRKELERRLIEAQRLEAVGRLAGGLAHDFNNLLTAIGGFANRILKRLRPESPLRADAAQIRKASDMAASLTSQLLAFSRRQIMQPVVLTLNEVVEDVEVMLRRLIGEDVELVIRSAPAPGLTLADPGQIRQVIMNLAVNARDAMPHGGVLTIETSNVEFGPEGAPDHPGVPPGEYVTVSVTDTGAGIPAEVLPHIFEPFYTTKEQGKGTGLGLSTVYGIVTQSGGYVRVSSEVGRGSTFVIYLPRIASGHEEEPALEPGTGEAALRGDETILLVEDAEAVRDLTRLTLTDHGYRVLEASEGNGAIALASGHEGRIHLLLTDVVMPRMSGREVAARIAVSRPGTKVIFMSGYTDNVDVRVAGEGDIPLMRKPFSEEELTRLVREVLDSARERPAAS